MRGLRLRSVAVLHAPTAKRNFRTIYGAAMAKAKAIAWKKWPYDPGQYGEYGCVEIPPVDWRLDKGSCEVVARLAKMLYEEMGCKARNGLFAQRS